MELTVMIRVALGSFTLFGVLHLAGWREHMAFLSGTAPTSSADLAAGLVYGGAWFFAVLVAPVLLVSGLVLRKLPARAVPLNRG